jgi:hypothetical protein
VAQAKQLREDIESLTLLFGMTPTARRFVERRCCCTPVPAFVDRGFACLPVLCGCRASVRDKRSELVDVLTEIEAVKLRAVVGSQVRQHFLFEVRWCGGSALSCAAL